MVRRETEHSRAIALSPRNGLPLARYVNYFAAIGRVDDAIEGVTRALAMEPLSLIISAQVGRMFYYARQYDQALDQERVSSWIRTLRRHIYISGGCTSSRGSTEEAIGELQKGFDLSGSESEMAGALGHAYAVSGKRGEAERVLATLKDRSKQQYVAPFDIAVIYAGLGDKSATLEWLDKAYDDRSTWLTWIKVDPRFDSIRNDPRYRDLVRRISVSWPAARSRQTAPCRSRTGRGPP